MHSIPLSRKRVIAFLIWLTGICVFLLFSYWNIQDSEMDAEDRLIAEAGRSAAQLAGLLGLPGYPLDNISANAIIDGAMEDDHVYAVRVDNNNGMLAGQRRNYLWEPIPWDDEMVENCVQGINTLKSDGEIVGAVSIWLSPRIYQEETAQIIRREITRFLCLFALWTLALFLVLLNWGDFRRLGAFMRKELPAHAPQKSGTSPIAESSRKNKNGLCLFDAETGRKYQRKNPDAFRVTAGMFRQTFARGPELINRLYAKGEFASLCHLGRMLELAAPCIGAEALQEAARNMRKALNDPECEQRGIPVEECAQILQEVLDALNGKEQWRDNATGPESE